MQKMALLNMYHRLPLTRLMNELDHLYYRPWPTLYPSYWDAFDGIENFEKTENGINKATQGWTYTPYIQKNKKASYLHLTFKPFYRFFHSYIIRRGFLDGVPGLAVATIDAYGVFSRYVKMILLEKGLK
jgi:hypothetical protein